MSMPEEEQKNTNEAEKVEADSMKPSTPSSEQDVTAVNEAVQSSDETQVPGDQIEGKEPTQVESAPKDESISSSQSGSVGAPKAEETPEVQNTEPKTTNVSGSVVFTKSSNSEISEKSSSGETPKCDAMQSESSSQATEQTQIETVVQQDIVKEDAGGDEATKSCCTKETGDTKDDSTSKDPVKETTQVSLASEQQVQEVQISVTGTQPSAAAPSAGRVDSTFKSKIEKARNKMKKTVGCRIV